MRGHRARGVRTAQPSMGQNLPRPEVSALWAQSQGQHIVNAQQTSASFFLHHPYISWAIFIRVPGEIKQVKAEHEI